MIHYRLKLLVVLFFLAAGYAIAGSSEGRSVYTKMLQDEHATYFLPDSFHFKADGKTDVSDLLQGAINKLKMERNFGIVFIPEGTYLITKTIYVPASIRLIGYGIKRPLIVLGKNSPGYRKMAGGDNEKPKYMFWFTGRLANEGWPTKENLFPMPVPARPITIAFGGKDKNILFVTTATALYAKKL